MQNKTCTKVTWHLQDKLTCKTENAAGCKYSEINVAALVDSKLHCWTSSFKQDSVMPSPAKNWHQVLAMSDSMMRFWWHYTRTIFNEQKTLCFRKWPDACTLLVSRSPSPSLYLTAPWVTHTRDLSIASPASLSDTQHPISGTDFLHHLDYHVPPLHPPVVLLSLDLLLACLIWCSTLVSKLTFSPGPFLHSFSQWSPSTTSWIFNHSRCWYVSDGVSLVQCGRLSSLC